MLSHLRNKRIMWFRMEDRNDLSYEGKGTKRKDKAKWEARR